MLETGILKKIKIIFFTCIALSVCFCGAAVCDDNATITCPVILVHGFAGWGPQELGEYRYWGGRHDIAAILREAGCTVHTATVGALSSNWDRAIELFYQIKGGQVDYGAEHSRMYGHLQRPEGYFYDEPFYPEWDAEHPVHLVGHSMGGQTVRMLSALLAGRSPEFQNVLRDTDNRSFTPGEGWIKSVITISTPHCGSALFDLQDNPLVTAVMVLQIAGISAADRLPAELYSFDLDQWNLTVEEDETLTAYLERIMETLGDTMDFSIRELSTHGAERFNTMVNSTSMDRSAYYFSYATEQTEPGPLNLFYYPELNMNPFFIDSSVLLGTAPAFTDRIDTGPQWRQNDGVVNTASMHAPVTGCRDTYSYYTGMPIRGLWNFIGTFPMDHFDVLGHQRTTSFQIRGLERFYRDLANLLAFIEQREACR